MNMAPPARLSEIISQGRRRVRCEAAWLGPWRASTALFATQLQIRFCAYQIEERKGNDDYTLCSYSWRETISRRIRGISHA